MAFSMKLFVIIAAGFVAAVVYGGIQGDDTMLAAGLSGAIICLALLPAFAVRSKRRRSIRERGDALICFEYSPAEAEEIAQAVRPSMRRTSIRISVLLSVCFAVIWMPFIVLSGQPDSELPSLWPAAAACVALPWLSVPVAPAVVSRRIRTFPCITVVGRSCVMIANRYPGINDRYALEAEDVCFKPGANGGMAVLKVRYRFRAGRTTRTFRHTVAVPVPCGREAEAAALRLQR